MNLGNNYDAVRNEKSLDSAIRDEISFDETINSFMDIATKAEESIELTEKGIKRRKGEIVIEYEMGYKGNMLHSAFQGGKEISRKDLGNTTIVIMEDAEGEKQKVYFSKPLGGIWVKGEPLWETDGYHCRITGEIL